MSRNKRSCIQAKLDQLNGECQTTQDLLQQLSENAKSYGDHLLRNEDELQSRSTREILEVFDDFYYSLLDVNILLSEALNKSAAKIPSPQVATSAPQKQVESCAQIKKEDTKDVLSSVDNKENEISVNSVKEINVNEEVIVNEETRIVDVTKVKEAIGRDENLIVYNEIRRSEDANVIEEVAIDQEVNVNNEIRRIEDVNVIEEVVIDEEVIVNNEIRIEDGNVNEEILVDEITSLKDKIESNVELEINDEANVNVEAKISQDAYKEIDISKEISDKQENETEVLKKVAKNVETKKKKNEKKNKSNKKTSYVDKKSVQKKLPKEENSVVLADIKDDMKTLKVDGMDKDMNSKGIHSVVEETSFRSKIDDSSKLSKENDEVKVEGVRSNESKEEKSRKIEKYKTNCVPEGGIVKVPKRIVKKELPLQPDFVSYDENDCLVANIETPSQFYIIPLELYPQFTKLSSEMCEQYNNEILHFSSKKEFLQLGDVRYFAVLFDGGWSRGKLVSIIEDSETDVRIFLLDYGATVCAHLSHVRVLNEEFYEHHPLAYRCHLDAIKPPPEDNGVWKESTSLFVSKIIMLQACHFTIEGRRGPSWSIVLRIGDNIVNSSLMIKNLAVPTDDDDDNVEELEEEHTEITAAVEEEHQMDAESLEKDSKQTYKAVTVNQEENLDLLNEPMGLDVVHDDLAMAVQGFSIEEEEKICKFYKGPPNKYCFKGPTCKKIHKVLNPDGWITKKELCDVQLVSRIEMPAPGTMIVVNVSLVINQVSFYGHILNILDDSSTTFNDDINSTELGRILKEMNDSKRVEAREKFTEIPTTGEMVAARFSKDNSWYRAIVTCPDSSCINVFYVDFGNSEHLPLSELRKLEPNFLDVPFQAVFFTLASVETPKDLDLEAAKADLKKMIENKQLYAHVTSIFSDSEIHVTLMDDDMKDIGDRMCELGHLEPLGDREKSKIIFFYDDMNKAHNTKSTTIIPTIVPG